MFHKIESNDLALLVSLGYTCVDVLQDWDRFSGCKKPIHVWLLVSCACAIGFRFARLLGSWVASSSDATAATQGSSRPIGGRLGECMLDMSQKGVWARIVESFTWTLFVPFFAVWNVIGTAWLWEVLQETPQCTPSDTHIWFSSGWLLLCHCWLIVHTALAAKAWMMKRNVQRAQANLRAVTDADAVARWGEVGGASGAFSLEEEAARPRGLCPEAITRLPCEVVPTSGFLHPCRRECAICLNDMCCGESVRHLPRCGHTFHRACIDLWMVRSTECPLCKQEVVDRSSNAPVTFC